MPSRGFIRGTAVASLGLLLVTLLGCGGGVNMGRGTITGLVFDNSGQIVRDALVYVDNGPEAYTNSTGSFTLANVDGGTQRVYVQAIQDGVVHEGESDALVNDGEISRTVNITVSPIINAGTLAGNVRDRFGFQMVGARVQIRQRTGGAPSAMTAFSNDSGNYRISGLKPGITYDVVATSRGYRGSSFSFQLNNGQTLSQNLTLNEPIGSSMPIPTGVTAVSWSSISSTRDARSGQALETIKRLLDPDRTKRKIQRMVNNNAEAGRAANGQVEVEVYWNRISNLDQRGFGIYRNDNSGEWFDRDFLVDPSSELFVDSGNSLEPGNDYAYSITSIATTYDGFRGESDFSDVAAVRPLGYLELLAPSGPGVRINWRAATGASRYAVYLFDRYPSVNVVDIFNNYESPVTTTSLTLPSGLVAGRTYYYLVLAENSDGSSKSVSVVGSFVAP